MPRHNNRRSNDPRRRLRRLSERELDALPVRARRHLDQHAERLALDVNAQTVSGDPDQEWPVFLSVGEDVDQLAARLAAPSRAHLAALPSLPARTRPASEAPPRPRASLRARPAAQPGRADPSAPSGIVGA